MRIKIKLPKNVGYILQDAIHISADDKEITVLYLEYEDNSRKHYRIRKTKYLTEDAKGIEIEFGNGIPIN